MHTPSRTAVVVGRFQVARLHRGHRHLLTSAQALAEQLIIVVGSSAGLPSARHPLSFAARAAMLAKAFPSATILEHRDHPNDHEQSLGLDRLIEAHATMSEVTLYGSRDSFLPYYSGRFPLVQLPELPGHAGSQARTQAAKQVGDSVAWRQGVIHAHHTRFPALYSTVDVAVLRPGHVLLGHKPTDGSKLRFIGGFVDTTDDSDEAAAKRELREEAGLIEVSDWRSAGSLRVDDWRYRNTPDRIMTRLYVATYVFGRPEPQDDIDTLTWVNRNDLASVLTPSHLPLGELLTEFLRQHPSL